VDNELPEGAIEVVLDEGSRASGPEPSSGTDTGAAQGVPGGQSPSGPAGGGNRTGFEQRIAQLTARRHDAERGENEQRDRAERLEAELARQKAQLEALVSRQDTTESYVQADYTARERAIQLHDLEGRIASLAADKAGALEVSDFPKAAQVDVEIAKALIEQRELEQAAQARPGSRAQPRQGEQPRQPAAPTDTKLAAFQARNEWFNRDPAKTAKAWEVHAEFKRSNPSMVGSEEYYRTLETRVNDHFNGGGNGGGRGMPPLSGGGAATNGSARNSSPTRVVLSAEQAQIARGLHLSPEQYARGLVDATQRGEIAGGRGY
jgi:hypothetical protein